MTLTTERLEECRNALAKESAADALALNFGWHELRAALDEIAAYRSLDKGEVVKPVAYRYRCRDSKGNLLPDWYYKEEPSAIGLPEEPLYASPQPAPKGVDEITEDMRHRARLAAVVAYGATPMPALHLSQIYALVDAALAALHLNGENAGKEG